MGHLLDNAATITAPRVPYQVQPFYTYLSNFGFRVLLVVDPRTGYTNLGHEPAPLYTCPLKGPKTDANCTGDGFASETDPNIGTDFRAGDHLKSALEYVKIGPVGMMFLPGEIPAELTVGLPAQLRTDPARWYETPSGQQAFGAADDHYEETNSAGCWPDAVRAVATPRGPICAGDPYGQCPAWAGAAAPCACSASSFAATASISTSAPGTGNPATCNVVRAGSFFSVGRRP